MKKWLAILLAGVMIMSTMTGCGETASYEKLNNDVIDVTATDAFGEHSIVILGDSISAGASAVDIPYKSWAGILREAVNAKTGDRNYGFASVEGTLWSTPNSFNIHKFPDSNVGFKDRGKAGKGFTEYRTAELLGTKGLGSSCEGATLTFTVQERFNYFCVYYEGGPDYGTFDVLDSAGNVLASVDAAAAEEGYTRTEMLDMTVLPEDNQIILKSTSDKEVIFTGLGYYDTPGGVVVSNYSNGGLQFAGTGMNAEGNTTGLDKKFLDLAATSGTMIFALGYNDVMFMSDKDLFAEKMDHLIAAVKASGTKVIVNDYCWDKSGEDKLFYARYPRFDFVKSEYKRLVEETGGVYVDQQAVNGDKILDTLVDGVHPDAEGHAMMGKAILEAMGLSEDTE